MRSGYSGEFNLFELESKAQALKVLEEVNDGLKVKP